MALVRMDCLSTAECLLLQLEGGPVGWSSFRYTPSQVDTFLPQHQNYAVDDPY